MRRRSLLAALAVLVAGGAATVGLASGSFADTGDPVRGAQAFRACAACHSLEPGRHMTGPSLAAIWDTEAGTQEGFRRYSDALREVDFTWRADTLAAFIADPQGLVPGTRMQFRGVDDARTWADLVAFLKAVDENPALAERAPSQQFPDLEDAPPARIVAAIRYCGDTYTVTTRDGKSRPFWEANLRFKTDSGDTGPEPGAPAIMPAGMMGDRASVIFAAPEEINEFVTRRC